MFFCIFDHDNNDAEIWYGAWAVVMIALIVIKSTFHKSFFPRPLSEKCLYFIDAKKSE